MAPEGGNYFSSGNTQLRRSSVGRTTGTPRKVEIHVPSSLSPLPQARIHASGRVQVHDRRTLERIARTRRKKLACGKVTLHHGIHQRAGPSLYPSPIVSCAYYNPSCSPYSPVVYTTKVTDHHGSDFSSPPRRQSRVVVEWSIDFDGIYGETRKCFHRRALKIF